MKIKKKTKMKKAMKDVFLQLMFNILKNLHELHNGLPILLETIKIEKVQKTYF